MKHVNLKLILSAMVLWIMFSHYFRKYQAHYNKITTIIIENKNAEPVDVYVTLGGVPSADTSEWVQSVYGMFGITSTGLTGKFTLQPKERVVYTPDPMKAVQGNVTFNREKINCPNGTTLVEFCFNNQFTVNTAQETCEISCVAGVSFLSSVEFKGGGNWTANAKGLDTIKVIHNNLIGKNSGLPGVYPFGCDDCTASVSPPKCTKGKNETPQKLPICNIQRSAQKGGGYIKINYWKKIN